MGSGSVVAWDPVSGGLKCFFTRSDLRLPSECGAPVLETEPYDYNEATAEEDEIEVPVDLDSAIVPSIGR